VEHTVVVEKHHLLEGSVFFTSDNEVSDGHVQDVGDVGCHCCTPFSKTKLLNEQLAPEKV
jgi:hypothetical protein